MKGKETSRHATAAEVASQHKIAITGAHARTRARELYELRSQGIEREREREREREGGK